MERHYNQDFYGIEIVTVVRRIAIILVMIAAIFFLVGSSKVYHEYTINQVHCELAYRRLSFLGKGVITAMYHTGKFENNLMGGSGRYGRLRK